MASDGSARRTALTLGLLVPLAALVTVVVSVVQVLVVLDLHDFAGVGFAVDGGRTAVEFSVAYTALLAVWLIGRVRPLGVALVLLVPVAVVVTVVLAWSDEFTLVINDRVVTVGYGVPFDWWMQDNWRTPPDKLMPYKLPSQSPWDTPTTVAWGPLAMDVLIVYALLGAALLTARLVGRRGSRTPPA